MFSVLLCLWTVGLFFPIFTIGDERYFISALEHGKGLTLPNIPLSPKEERYERARLLVVRNQGVIGPKLEQGCFIGDCDFDFVKSLIHHIYDRTLYWKMLNCFKHGVACGDASHWLEWGEWSNCSATCGDGQKVRRRRCYVAGVWGNNICDGIIGELKKCSHYETSLCLRSFAEPDDWGNWGPWSTCDKTCGDKGSVVRTRRCEPSGMNAYCVGSNFETRTCHDVLECNVHGNWGEWSNWGKCVVRTCIRSFAFRERTCSNPPVAGLGVRCLGSAVQVRPCQGLPCKFSDVHAIARFSEDSSIAYQPHESYPYLSVVIRFRPSKDGLLFRHTGLTKSSLFVQSSRIKISYLKPISPAKTANKNYVEVSILNFKLRVSLVVEGSDAVTMDVGNVKMLQWNIVRLLIVSDVVSARLNDGPNMKATLQDSPVKPQTTYLTHEVEEKRWWGNLWKSDAGVPHPDAPGFSLTRKTRAILASFKGRISLGKHKDNSGFRGEISFLRVNYQSLGFAKKSRSQVSTNRDPIGVNNIALLNQFQSSGYAEEQLPLFDGYHRFYMPNTLVYWDRGFVGPAYSSQPEARMIRSIDGANLRIVFKPQIANGVLLWNRGENNLATQWKVVIQDGVRVKFVATLFGGQVYVATSGDDLWFANWNVLDLIFYRRGEVSIKLNEGNSSSVVMPYVNQSTVPGPMIVVGGSRKSNALMEPFSMLITHSLLPSSVEKSQDEHGGNEALMTFGNPIVATGRSLYIWQRSKPPLAICSTSFIESLEPSLSPERVRLWIEAFSLVAQFNLSDDRPSSIEDMHVSGFRGYIYSIKQNGVEFVHRGRDFRNAWGMPPIELLSKPMFTKFWYFKPLYQAEVYNADERAGPWRRFLNFFRLFGIGKKVLVWESNMTLAQIRELGEIHEVACVIPVSEDILTPPDIRWYRNGVPVKESRRFLVRKTITPKAVRSSVFLMPTADASRELSGVYSCVLLDHGRNWLYVNHVVSILNNNIADPNSYLTRVLFYIRETTGATELQSMFIGGGSLIGFLFFLVLACLFQKWLTRKKKLKKKQRKAKGKNVKQLDDDNAALSRGTPPPSDPPTKYDDVKYSLLTDSDEMMKKRKSRSKGKITKKKSDAEDVNITTAPEPLPPSEPRYDIFEEVEDVKYSLLPNDDEDDALLPTEDDPDNRDDVFDHDTTLPSDGDVIDEVELYDENIHT